MGLFDDVFGGGRGAAAKRMKKGQERAMEEYQGAWGEERGYLDPQLGAGFGGMTAQQAMLDPNQFYQNIMSGYEMSPAAQREMAVGEEAIQNQMAAAGLGGSSNAARDAARYARDFSSEDMQRYFQNQMGIFGQGMGIGQNLASFRDLLGQRMGQGRIGMGQADAMQALGRAGGLQQGLATALQGLGQYNQPQGMQGGDANTLMQLGRLLGGL